MQNIDYSRLVKKTPQSFSSGQRDSARSDSQRGRNSATGGSDYVRNRNRTLSLIAVVGMVMFSLGVVGGFQLNRLQHIEENLVRYPDEQRKAMVDEVQSKEQTVRQTTSFANYHPESERQQRVGRYIIHLGVFDRSRAEKITASLNNVPELAARRPDLCHGFDESIPDRYLSFRSAIESKPGKQNVYAGCFTESEEAYRFLEKVKSSSISGTAAARLYRID